MALADGNRKPAFLSRALSQLAMDQIRASTATGKALARRYGVSEALISRIRGGLHAHTTRNIEQPIRVIVPAAQRRAKVRQHRVMAPTSEHLFARVRPPATSYIPYRESFAYKVIRHFVEHDPGDWAYASDLERWYSTGTGNTHAMLRRAIEVGYLAVEQEGPRRRYMAGPEIGAWTPR